MIYLIFAILLIAFIIFSIRFTWWRKSISYDYPRVLMYHMISEHLPKNRSKFNRLRVKPKEFEKQLIWLKKNGFTSFTLNELSKLEKIPSKSVVITFDDGYEDNFTNAFRLLKKYNMKATIFIVLNRFNADWATDKDLNQSSYELNKERMLSDEQVKTMLQSGLIEIGSHTLNHANLPKISNNEKQNEIENSKKEIETKFNIKCESFAYPFGFYDEKSRDFVRKFGYKSAVTTQNSVYFKDKFNEFEIPRILISGRQGMLAFILKMKNGRVR
ncbi:polysaccharide deacetylase family protein [Campylobacter hyointestinalis]|uniref:polysaccharide deacetylase family protein n=1 Tax=Campylobacter hyointestinalis TaxID=198 RepID=UPI000CE3D6C2|nr:polysaccharide deacetylase family protein [Campylobacter hyointestinalis]PPB63715.1 polysaccharide deacetylase [Campylobacter hyointestinalis subsp. hyointestinalis]